MSKEIRNCHREQWVTGECSPARPLTDAEWKKYGQPRPNSKELYWILKNPQKAAEYQSTYGLSNQEMTEIRQCIAQQGYEIQLDRLAEKRKANRVEIETGYSEEIGDIEIIPVGLIRC